MTNNNDNQNLTTVFSLQSHLAVVQNLPTSTRLEAVPKHIRLSEPAVLAEARQRQVLTRVLFDSTRNGQTNSGANASRLAPGRAVQRQNTQITQTLEERVEKRTPYVLRQDKRRLETARIASGQPAADTKSTRALTSVNDGVRSQNQTSVAQKNDRITLWGVDPTRSSKQNLSVSREETA
jgi:hypothetical protein